MFKEGSNRLFWVEDSDSIDVLNHNSDGDIGHVLDVYVEYPKTLSKQHNEFPFLPEKMKLGKVEKLVSNLSDKERYIDYCSRRELCCFSR